MTDSNKVALVTGGARGIGRAIAEKLAEDGWYVAVNYNKSREAAAALAEQIRGIAIEGDVSNEEAVKLMFRELRDKVGEVRLLVNNAGVSYYGLLQNMSAQNWRRVFSINTDAVFYCCREALPAMIRDKNGNIINIASMWGQTGAALETAYSASKAAVIGLTKALAKECGPSGIRVNCIAPGCVDTDMLSDFSPEDIAELKERTPVSRIGKPSDIAHLTAFLASDNSCFITGQIIACNGGFHI